MWWTAVFEEIWTASYLPSNKTTWEAAVDAVDANLTARDPVGLIASARSDAHSPLAWLPYLAAERSVDEFSSSWPESRQRSVVAGSFALHQRLGVRAALDRAISSLGYGIRVTEWFETTPFRAPYTFRIEIFIPDDEEWAASQRTPILRAANSAKNAHTKLEAISLHRKAPPSGVYVGAVARRRRVMRVGQVPKPTTMRVLTHTFIGAFTWRRRTIRVLPRP